MGMLSMIKAAPKAVAVAVGKTAFALRKVKPQILLGGGIVVATGAFVLAIVNARKMDDVIFESDSKITDLEMRKAEAEKEENNLSEEEKKSIITMCDKDIRKAKRESTRKMFLLLGVPSVMFAGGIMMIVGGHTVLVRRFGQLSASMAALKESFDRYRAANIAEHGRECDRKYMYGIVGETEVKTKVTDENGNETEVTCNVPIVDGEAPKDIYTFEFSERTSRKCPRDPVRTISFLKSQQKFWNTMMQTTGKPVTLDMVLSELGIEMDPDNPANDYALIAGWRPNGDGDNAIDFGIMRAVNRHTLGMEDNVVMLNFNCDGNIYHSARYTKDGRKVGGK